ncbi:MAG: acyl carrier protein [Halothiobacillus sp.]
MSDIEEQLYQLLMKELPVAREGLTRDSTLESIGLDSLATIEFMFQIEDHFGIRFEQTGTPPKTLGDVFDEVHAKLEHA